MSYLNELLAGYRQGLADGCQVPITTARDALGRAVDPRQRGRLLAVVAIALADDTPEVPAEHPVPLTKGAKKTPPPRLCSPAMTRVASPRAHDGLPVLTVMPGVLRVF